MAYQNYTVSVQGSATPYLPNNALELFLFENRVEIKNNPATGYKDVYVFGTTQLARSVAAVYDRYGALARAVASDADRPGEYTFYELDLNVSGSNSALGQALYSVVARPLVDAPIDDNFNNASVIIDRIYISDPNTKANVFLTGGAFDSAIDNIYFAGGSVAYEQYDGGDATSTTTVQYIRLLNLPTAITAIIQYDGSNAPPFGSLSTTTTCLIPRFNVLYGSADGTASAIWTNLRAYKMSDGTWVIQLKADQYNVYRSAEFGSGAGQINLASVYTLLTIGLNISDNNILIKKLGALPDVSTGMPAGDVTELSNFTILKEENTNAYYSTLHMLDNYYGDVYNWRQVLMAPAVGVSRDYTYNPNKSRAILADGTNVLATDVTTPTSSLGVLNLRAWWPRGASHYPVRLVAGNISSVRQISIQRGDAIGAAEAYSDIDWTSAASNYIMTMVPSTAVWNPAEWRIGFNVTSAALNALAPYNFVVKGVTLGADFYDAVYLGNDSSGLSNNLQVVGTKGSYFNNGVFIGGSGATTRGRVSIYERSSAPVQAGGTFADLYAYHSGATYELHYMDSNADDHTILWSTGGVADHALSVHSDYPYIVGGGSGVYTTTFYSNEAYTIPPAHSIYFRGRYNAVPDLENFVTLTGGKLNATLNNQAGTFSIDVSDSIGSDYTCLLCTEPQVILSANNASYYVKINSTSVEISHTVGLEFLLGAVKTFDADTTTLTLRGGDATCSYINLTTNVARIYNTDADIVFDSSALTTTTTIYQPGDTNNYVSVSNSLVEIVHDTGLEFLVGAVKTFDADSTSVNIRGGDGASSFITLSTTVSRIYYTDAHIVFNADAVNTKTYASTDNTTYMQLSTAAATIVVSGSNLLGADANSVKVYQDIVSYDTAVTTYIKRNDTANILYIAGSNVVANAGHIKLYGEANAGQPGDLSLLTGTFDGRLSMYAEGALVFTSINTGATSETYLYQPGDVSNYIHIDNSELSLVHDTDILISSTIKARMVVGAHTIYIDTFEAVIAHDTKIRLTDGSVNVFDASLGLTYIRCDSNTTGDYCLLAQATAGVYAFVIPSGVAAGSGTITEGGLYYDTIANRIYVSKGGGNWGHIILDA